MVSRTVYCLTFVSIFAVVNAIKFHHDFATCMRDVAGMKDAYYNFLDNYLQKRHERDAMYKDIIKDSIKKYKLSKRCYRAWPKYSIKALTYRIFATCGGVLILHQPFDMTPDFKDWSDITVCAWISETFPRFRRQLEHNEKVIKNCNVRKVIRSLLIRNWWMCNRWSKDAVLSRHFEN